MSTFNIEPSARIKRLPPYLMGKLNVLKHKKRQAGVDVIDLGMGNPLDPTPDEIVEKLREAARDPRNQRYSISRGIPNLRLEVAKKYERIWDVSLNPENEVITCIGSKEGFSHTCLAMLGPGDTAIVPDPYFPIHVYAIAIAGANVISVPLGNDQAFLKRIADVCEHLYPKPKLVVLNYPHNPTAMTVDEGFFDEVVALANKYKFAVIHDMAYGETCFDGYKAPSFLSAKGAKDVGVEFTTMSKPYNMAGWRVGFCAGNAKIIEALHTIKGYYDYGNFQAVQIAAIIALRNGDKSVAEQALKYQSRRDVVCQWLDKIGWQTETPRASMFVWTKVLDEHLRGMSTLDYAIDMLEHAEVNVAPGRAFGENGEGYLRIAIVENEQRLRQGMKQIQRFVQSKSKRRQRS
jgi:alanine-synthesizing transaminase